jgi:hypothetical protein
MIPQELRSPVLIGVSVVFAILVALFSIYVLRMGNDNIIEEAAEDFIEHVSGIKLDLSEGGE